MERMKGLELMDEALPELKAHKIKAHTYATKPVVVEAIRISKDNIQWVADWCGGEVHESYIAYGRMYSEDGQEFPQRISKLPEFNAYIGDWVVKFKDNLFSPMSDKEFNKKYHRTGLRLA